MRAVEINGGRLTLVSNIPREKIEAPSEQSEVVPVSKRTMTAIKSHIGSMKSYQFIMMFKKFF